MPLITYARPVARLLPFLFVSLLLFQGCVKRGTATRARTNSSVTGPSRRTACSSIRADGKAPVVDDFETEPRRILANEGRGGWWFSYDDGTKGHLERESVEVDAGTRKNRALHVMSSGFTKWGAGFGFNLHPEATQLRACAYDASAYDGIRFRARGSGRVRVVLGDPTNIPPALGGACRRPTSLCHDRPGVWANFEVLNGRHSSFRSAPFSPKAGEARATPQTRRNSSVFSSGRVPTRILSYGWMISLSIAPKRATPNLTVVQPAPLMQCPAPPRSTRSFSWGHPRRG